MFAFFATSLCLVSSRMHGFFLYSHETENNYEQNNIGKKSFHFPKKRKKISTEFSHLAFKYYPENQNKSVPKLNSTKTDIL